jgi:Holliday junction resolvasome RuvABC DNA-binding subunit
LHLKGETSPITLPRIQALESLGFVWNPLSAFWEDRLSELADYRKVYGHCNVPQKYSENAKLGMWVATQRKQYSLHLKGETSQMTLPRIEALERLGFKWGVRGAACTWEDCLSELADYRKIHGHCNVPCRYSGNAKLGTWVGTQRTQYRLHQEGKTSSITLPRIQALESLGFEWKPISRMQGKTIKSNLDDDVTSARVRAVESIGIKQPYGVKMLSMVEKSATIKSTSLSNLKNPTGRAKSTSTLCQVEAQKRKSVDGVHSLSDETDLDGSPSKQDMMQQTWLASYGTIFG